MFCRKCGSTLNAGACKKCGTSADLQSCHSDLERILYPTEKKYRVVWMVQRNVWEEQQLSPGTVIVPKRPAPSRIGSNARFLGWWQVPAVMPEHDLRINAKVSSAEKKRWYHSRKFWYAVLFLAVLACILGIVWWTSIR